MFRVWNDTVSASFGKVTSPQMTVVFNQIEIRIGSNVNVEKDWDRSTLSIFTATN